MLEFRGKEEFLQWIVQVSLREHPTRNKNKPDMWFLQGALFFSLCRQSKETNNFPCDILHPAIFSKTLRSHLGSIRAFFSTKSRWAPVEAKMVKRSSSRSQSSKVIAFSSFKRNPEEHLYRGPFLKQNDPFIKVTSLSDCRKRGSVALHVTWWNGCKRQRVSHRARKQWIPVTTRNL